MNKPRMRTTAYNGPGNRPAVVERTHEKLAKVVTVTGPASQLSVSVRP
jgi:hypothetical protein